MASNSSFSSVRLSEMDKWVRANGGVSGIANRAMRSYASKFMARPGNLAAPVMHLMVGAMAIGYILEIPHLMGTFHTSTLSLYPCPSMPLPLPVLSPRPPPSPPPSLHPGVGRRMTLAQLVPAGGGSVASTSHGDSIAVSFTT